MRRTRSLPGIRLGIAVALLAVAGIGAAGAPCYAQGRPSPPEFRAIEMELGSLQAQLAAGEAELQEMRSRGNAGNREELRGKEMELQMRREQVENLQRQLVRARLVQKLERPVDVKLRDATVAEAARVLSQASDLPITVDPALGTTGRVTASATGVPAGEVLRLLAQNTRAQIAPAPEANGVVLRPVPTLETGGVRREFPGPTPPWSGEWMAFGGPPPSGDPLQATPVPAVAAGGAGRGFGGFGQRGFGGAGRSGQGGFGSGFGQGGFGRGGGAGQGAPPGAGGFARGGAGTVAPVPVGGFPGSPGQPGFPGAPAFGNPGPSPGGDMPLAITALGPDRFIVATRGWQPRPGQPGGPIILLSLYELRGGQMHLVSTVPHEAGGPPGPMPRAGPGAPMPGGGPGGPGQPGTGPQAVPRPLPGQPGPAGGPGQPAPARR